MTPHRDWRTCEPRILNLTTGDIDKNATFVAQAYWDALTDEQKQTFHEATCQNASKTRHRVLMNRFLNYLKNQNVA